MDMICHWMRVVNRESLHVQECTKCAAGVVWSPSILVPKIVSSFVLHIGLTDGVSACWSCRVELKLSSWDGVLNSSSDKHPFCRCG